MFYSEADSGGVVVGDVDPYRKTGCPVHPDLNAMLPGLRFQREFLPAPKFGYRALVYRHNKPSQRAKAVARSSGENEPATDLAPTTM